MLGLCGTAPVRLLRYLRRQPGNRHGSELHPLHLLQQPELIEVDGRQAGLGAGARSLIIRFGVLTGFGAAEVLGRALLRLAAHDLFARLGRPVGEGARIGQTIGSRHAVGNVVLVDLFDPQIDRAGIGALEDLSGVNAGLAVGSGNARP